MIDRRALLLTFASCFPLVQFSTPLPFLLALASAAFYGAADFLGGLAARRTHASAVVVVSGSAGLVLLAALLPVMPGHAPSLRDLLWGATAGLAGGIGIALLYRALAIGRMAVVAPTTALCAVAIPVVAGILRGERPAALTLVGMMLAVVAIVLVSQSRDSGLGAGDSGLGAAGSRMEDPDSGFGGVGSALGVRGSTGQRGVGLALLSGVAIGFFYLALAETSPDAGLWPLLVARGTSVLLFGAIALVSRHSLRMPAPVLRLVVAGGLLDMIANALYVLATRGGPLSVVVTLASLYPASTVILARSVLGERLSAWQVAGVVCALVAVVLIVGAA
jgi:drug/metabolite transporter (DMT)-like permease